MWNHSSIQMTLYFLGSCRKYSYITVSPVLWDPHCPMFWCPIFSQAPFSEYFKVLTFFNSSDTDFSQNIIISIFLQAWYWNVVLDLYIISCLTCVLIPSNFNTFYNMLGSKYLFQTGLLSKVLTHSFILNIWNCKLTTS